MRNERMIPGIRGQLVSSYFAEHHLADRFGGRLGEATRPVARRRFAAWWAACERTLGPASSLRALFDVGARPLLALLGLPPGRLVWLPAGDGLLAPLPGAGSAAALVGAWDADLGPAWRDARQHLAMDVAWVLAFNGRALRLIEAPRPYAARFLEFDLEAAAGDERTFSLLWAVLRRDAFESSAAAAGGCLLDAVLETAARYATGVCRSLRDGVLTALAEILSGLVATGHPGRRRRRPAADDDLDAPFEQALTIVYRILFLLFAEARGLVPTWHPTYRDSYTIEALRDMAEGSGDASGLWESLQAIARLAASGCRAGDLVVTPFNGRLFSAQRTPLAESTLDDERARRALAALSSRTGRGQRRERIAYRDLGVEQLGAVYESVLDYRPRRVQAPATTVPAAPAADLVRLERQGVRRKATGSFYTPRSITDYLVRRTLAPLVRGAGPEAILSLRIVDPAMGSGAFLVAACRYLSAQYEAALTRRGDCRPEDIGPADRSAFRRTIALRCLYGVDANPTAVQLARLSIWLATLAADKPLTFLDHHFVTGDSLVGASLEDIRRQPPGQRRRPAVLPLFDEDAAGEALREALPVRAGLAATPDDTADDVRRKERALERLADPEGLLSRWKAAADAWCAAWFLDDRQRLPPGLFGELTDAIVRGRSTLPAALVTTWRTRLAAVAAANRFFHWTLEFPEVFFDEAGRPLAAGGFDAVIGNPPWDMLRADTGEQADRERADVGRRIAFVRDSGLYRARSHGHPNLYQLFVERALRIARPGGRLGLVVPSGLFTDHGSAGLRRLLLERCDTDAVVGIDNRAGIFPIHRSTTFLLLSTTVGRPTARMACLFHASQPAALDALDDDASRGTRGYPVSLTPALIRRLGGDTLTIPLLATADDLALTERLTSCARPLADPLGWGARFGRELNATDDRAHLHAGGGGLPIVEGRQIEPFRVDLTASRLRIGRRAAARLVDPAATYERARLAYRDVAGATNRLSLIAAVLPSGCLTVHTVFCLKTPLPDEDQLFLCGLLNSLVLNYLVRQRMTTHATTAMVHRLPAPRPPRASDDFRRVVEAAGALEAGAAAREDRARLQAAVARLYGLTRAELQHVLTTFPLLDDGDKAAVLAACS
ncbi:MAG: N-6 DNA methylase [Acidobacteriota bacterium]|nr:N-6 DNA methylase [Acidobacteriota bacterium]